MKTLLALITCLLTSVAFSAEREVTVTLNPGRTITIKGEVNEASLTWATKIERLASPTAPKEDIDILISSGGGSVALGSQVLSAIKIAQSRGFKIRCFVPLLAASMAFQIFAACDERYALRYALLLWHPMKASFQGSATSEDMLYSAKRLQGWEVPFITFLLSKLKIDYETFEYHRTHETLWMAHEFSGVSKDFLTVVDDIQNAGDIFSIR